MSLPPSTRGRPLPPALDPRLPRSRTGVDWRRVLVGTAILLGTGVLLGGLLALALRAVLPQSSRPGAAAGSTPAPTSSKAAPAAPTARVLEPARVRGFDPEGDNEVNENQVRLATDDDPDTAWQTERYTSADFGRLKSGVGLRVDLGAARPVRSVTLLLDPPGAAVQVRASATGGSGLSSYRVVGTVKRAGRAVTVRPSAAGPYRYWLIWFTSLPKDGSGYRAGVAGFSFRG